MSKSEVVELKINEIGKSALRKEDATLLTGRGEFIADVVLPGMLHAVIVRSPYAHAAILNIDLDDAHAVPGVETIWTGSNTRPLCAGLVGAIEVDGFVPTTQPLIAADEVRYVGEAVAIVVAKSRGIAEDAAELVDVEYDALPVVASVDDAARADDLANSEVTGNVFHRVLKTNGDTEAAFTSAKCVVSGTFRNNRISAAPMETRGCVAHYDWTSDRLKLWSSTQMPGLNRTLIAMTLQIPEQTIEIIIPHVGGGFGQKAHLFTEELALCLLAREIGVPISWIEDRQENLLAATHSKHQVNYMAIAVDANGRLLALNNHSVTDGGAYHNVPWTADIESTCGLAMLTGPYKIALARAEALSYATNKCPIGAYRGVGWTAGQTARENLIDRAAREIGLSPFEIRRRNVIRTEDFPYTNANGLLFREGTFLETVDTLERMVDYPAFRERQSRERERGTYLGLGISIFNELSGMGTRALEYIDVPTATHDTSTVRVDPTGTVTVTTSLTSQGQGHQTTLAQIAADAFGVPLEKVVVRANSTANTWGTGTWGSRAAVIGAGSIGRAANIVRNRIKEVAAHLLDTAPEDIEFDNGRVHPAEVPEKGMSLADVAGAIYFAEGTHPAGFDPTLEATATFDPAEVLLANGGHAAIVEIDADTGIARVEKVFAVEDCGRMINPMIVEGQIRGGIGQAIGASLLEELVHDEEGQLVTTTYLDYLLPSAADVPDIEIAHLETPTNLVPGGIKGMGESAMISAPAAIIGAVNDALDYFGARLERFPASPRNVFDALQAVRR